MLVQQIQHSRVDDLLARMTLEEKVAQLRVIWNNKDKTLEGERLDNLMRGGVKTCDSVGKAAPAPEDPGAVH